MNYVIGCNLVDVGPESQKEFYTFSAYKRMLKNYERFQGLIGALEFSHLVNVTPEEGEKIGRMARELGFQTWSIHSEHLNIGDKLENYLELQKHEAEVCAALGCKVMVCHLPNLRPYVDFERDLDVIGRVAELASSCGVKLAVENAFYCTPEHHFVSDIDLVLRIVETLDSEDTGINLDSGHAFLGETFCEPDVLNEILSGQREEWLSGIVRKIGKHLFTTHLQDDFGLRDEHQPPGLGYIDWELLLNAIADTGYQGPLMMEMTGTCVKSRRTVEQLREFPLEKEIVFGAGYLKFLQKKQNQSGS